MADHAELRRLAEAAQMVLEPGDAMLVNPAKVLALLDAAERGERAIDLLRLLSSNRAFTTFEEDECMWCAVGPPFEVAEDGDGYDYMQDVAHHADTCPWRESHAFLAEVDRAE